MERTLDALAANIQTVIHIDSVKLEYLIAALISGGHVLLADTHGVGKTSLARALAASISWPTEKKSSAKKAASDSVHGADSPQCAWFNRVQCTVDLLPQDILGYSRLDGATHEMVFQPGPIFSHFLLCDEINLLPPKTQGGFFQAMEEKMVSVEGKTWQLPELFFIIATMNLKGSHLFPLPLPQLDRFMLQLSLGYPELEQEQAIIKQHGKMGSWAELGAVISSKEILQYMDQVDTVPIHDDVIAYITALVRASRKHPLVETGASPRSGIKLSRLARALCLVRNADYVSIDMIKELAPVCLSHRIQAADSSVSSEGIVDSLLSELKTDPSTKSLLRKK